MSASLEQRRPFRTLLFESSLAGHGFDFVRLQVPAFLEFGPVTLCTLPESLGNPVFTAFAEQYRSRGFTVDASVRKHFPSGWRNLWHGYWNLVRAVKKHKPDLIFITSGSNFVKAFSIFKAHWLAVRPVGCRVELIVFTVSGAYPAESVKRRMKNRFESALLASSPVDRMHVSDVLAFYYLAGIQSIRPGMINLCPDPVEMFSESSAGDVSIHRNRLGLPINGRMIGCVGVMDERKGIPLLLDAFANASLKGNDRLLLAGQMSPFVRELSKSRYSELIASGKIICLDRFLTKDELDAAILALDVVCTPYPYYRGPASILLRAAASHKPVLSSNFGWLGWITERFALGKTCNVTDRDAFRMSIVEALDSSCDYSQGDSVTLLLQFHDWRNFESHLTAGARSLLGLEAKPLITWETVNDGIKGASPEAH